MTFFTALHFATHISKCEGIMHLFCFSQKLRHLLSLLLLYFVFRDWSNKPVALAARTFITTRMVSVIETKLIRIVFCLNTSKVKSVTIIGYMVCFAFNAKQNRCSWGFQTLSCAVLTC